MSKRLTGPESINLAGEEVREQLLVTTDANAAAPLHKIKIEALGQRRANGRRATASLVRAINSISDGLQLDLANWLNQRFGLRVPGELSIGEVSGVIDELKALPSINGNGRHS